MAFHWTASPVDSSVNVARSTRPGRRCDSRAAMGVTLFRLDAGERVTSVFPVVDDDSNDEASADRDGGGEGPPDGEETDA